MTSKGLHAFFTSARNHSALHEERENSPSQYEDDHARSSNGEPVEMEQNVNRLTTPPSSQGITINGVDQNASRKRRKLNQAADTSPYQKSHASTSTLASPPLNATVDQHLHAHDDIDTQTISPQPQRKQTLKLNGKGGFSTPRRAPSKIADVQVQPSSDKVKTRRTKKPQSSLIAVIPYGKSDKECRGRFGQQLNAILDSQPRTAQADVAPASAMQSAPMHSKAINPLKPTHPFFSAKPVAKGEFTSVERAPDDQDPPTPRIRSFTTPVKKMAPFPIFDQMENAPTSWAGSGMVASKKSVQHGLREPIWPPRALNYRPAFNVTNPTPEPQLRGRTGKQKPVEIVASENVLDLLTKSVAAKRCDSEQKTSYISPPMQLPTRSIESASSLKAKVMQELDKFDNSRIGITQPRHPALIRILARIGKTLSAFDRGECDTHLWTQKYEPRSAQTVLQSPRETSLLRDWLSNLAVDHVESRLQPVNDLQNRGNSSRRKSKKRFLKGKTHELDDFIVSSDDEGQSASITDLHDFDPSTSALRDFNPSDQGRNLNVVLISGPHGCGKTAAVHAVAQELQFEIFEINSASRRSGKDLLERVGNMTLNHQVRQQTQHGQVPDATPLSVLPTQRPGLSSFFTSQSASHPESTEQKQGTHQEERVRKLPKKQTQALILLEEVDVLFDDDKQFWETVVDLARQSRRPIIMTCRDERALPFDELSLHAIFRFQNPSPDLVAPYMMSIAAAEGHMLSIDALQSLYATKKLDLRASIMELQFRCQKSVGDDKGGMSWQLSRWPPGADVNEAGEIKHVVSNNTFLRGMDTFSSQTVSHSLEVQAIEAWTGHCLDSLDFAHDICTTMAQSTCHTGSCGWFDSITSLSDADCFSAVGLPTQPVTPDEILDASPPFLTDREAHDFTTTYKLLQADPRPDFIQASTSLRTAVAFRASSLLAGYASLCHLFREKMLADLEMPQSSIEASKTSVMNKAAHAIEPLLDDDSLLLRPAVHTDIAPYARSIAAYDISLDAHRAVLSSGGGKAATSLRRTRAARSAMEGGQRAITRRDRWFGDHADCTAILATAGKNWPRCDTELVYPHGQADIGSSIVGEGNEVEE